MNARMRAKADEIMAYCLELEQILPESLEQYQMNFEKRAACERYFEKIVEAIVDLGHLRIRHDGTPMPQEDNQVFLALAKSGAISEDLAGRLRNAKGMRNILAHEYGSVNDELVFLALTEEIVPDARAFVTATGKK